MVLQRELDEDLRGEEPEGLRLPSFLLSHREGTSVSIWLYKCREKTFDVNTGKDRVRNVLPLHHPSPSSLHPRTKSR